jgi:hypothetical protein
MRNIHRKLRGNEKGQALVLAVILLGLGALMLTPLLAFMSTGLSAGKVFEVKTEELYAADAGVEDAVWEINNLGQGITGTTEGGRVVSGQLPPYHNWDTDGDGDIDNDDETYYFVDYSIDNVNGIIVEVHMQWIQIGVYRVLSTAEGTTVEAFITSVYSDYTGITDSVITSPSGYTLLGGPTMVEPGEGEEHGPNGDYDGPWPTAEGLSLYYSIFVDKDNPYDYVEIDLNDEATFDYDFITIDPVDSNIIHIGSTYVDGDFYVHNSSNTGKTLILDGTLYVTGITELGCPKDWALDLNGNTIYVESDVTGGGASGTALWIDSGVTLKTSTGAGCIIAIGDINFAPHMDSGPGEYILILSVIGQTWMHPVGDFYGTLAGNSEVFIQNGQAHWSDPDIDGDGIPDVNFPGGSGATMVFGVLSWKIS